MGAPIRATGGVLSAALYKCAAACAQEKGKWSIGRSLARITKRNVTAVITSFRTSAIGSFLVHLTELSDY
jgi:hypothetical protein